MPYTYKHLATHYLVAQHIFQNHANHIYVKAVKRQKVDTLINGEQNNLWSQSMSNELIRIAQGENVGVKTNDYFDFIYHWDFPDNRKVAYANFVCNYRPLKSYQYRICLVVGGEKLDYALDAGLPSAYMLKIILLVKSVISDAK